MNCEMFCCCFLILVSVRETNCEEEIIDVQQSNKTSFEEEKTYVQKSNKANSRVSVGIKKSKKAVIVKRRKNFGFETLNNTAISNFYRFGSYIAEKPKSGIIVVDRPAYSYYYDAVDRPDYGYGYGTIEKGRIDIQTGRDNNHCSKTIDISPTHSYLLRYLSPGNVFNSETDYNMEPWSCVIEFDILGMHKYVFKICFEQSLRILPLEFDIKFRNVKVGDDKTFIAFSEVGQSGSSTSIQTVRFITDEKLRYRQLQERDILFKTNEKFESLFQWASVQLYKRNGKYYFEQCNRLFL